MAAPILMWFRRDLRLADNRALAAACARGRPVIPVFLHDEVLAAQGAAPRFRLGLSLAALAADLEDQGSRLILRRGRALDCLRALVGETGAEAVHWTRLYDPESRKRDAAVKAALKGDGIAAESFPGHLLWEPWEVETRDGGFYKVYSPMWRAVQDRDPGMPMPRPGRIAAPAGWPESDDLEDWTLGADMRRGAAVVAPHQVVGETAASHRLAAFAGHRMADYKARRDFPAEDATSGLSENLACGEISPRNLWASGLRGMEEGKAGAEHFLKELVWREFAYHLMYHTPRIVADNWRENWADFPWKEDPEAPEVRAWKRGRTGEPFVDAAMRQMFVTGTMHNRARMIVASYLTKHLMTHWRVGMAWFETCLTDWDPAANALGWQWTAGSGPDAAPYFRVFNPATQLEKFDADGRYRRAWIAEGRERPTETALSYFDAIPGRWALSPDDAYPEPIVDLKVGRDRALAAYGGFK